ncbi:MAG: TonB-dependent receptor plug domain-containing protein, partial [Muribaculaceae bacterium]
MKRILNSVLAVFITLSAYAQDALVTGNVVDQNNEPLIGVSIKVKGQKTATATDVNGEFKLKSPSNAILEFSYIGMSSMEQAYKGSPMRVTMKEDQKNLEEVVVIGYQSVKKADLTGAVSVFRPDKMKNTVVTGTVGDALSTVPGLFVRSSGKPGAEGMVEVRGTSTFGSSAPLYVVDGVALEGAANRDFNFNDIESIQVLKDASAAAIYGSRAANGVIIITTKQGKDGPMKVDFSA